MDLKVGDRVDIDSAELGRCVVERIEGRDAIVRSSKVSARYENEPGDDHLYAFKADMVAQKKIKSGRWLRRR